MKNQENTAVQTLDIFGDEGSWETVIDFTTISKHGVPIEKVIAALKANTKKTPADRSPRFFRQGGNSEDAVEFTHRKAGGVNCGSSPGQEPAVVWPLKTKDEVQSQTANRVALIVGGLTASAAILSSIFQKMDIFWTETLYIGLAFFLAIYFVVSQRNN